MCCETTHLLYYIKAFGRGERLRHASSSKERERERERELREEEEGRQKSRERRRKIIIIMDFKIVKAFFKPNPDPKTLCKRWQSRIRKEQRQLDAQVRDIERELAKTRREIKACLKRKDARSAKVLAIQTCKARKTIEALYETKANYNSISMRLGESVARLSQVGSLGKSSEILKVRKIIRHLHACTPIGGALSFVSKKDDRGGDIFVLTSFLIFLYFCTDLVSSRSVVSLANSR